MEDNLEYRQKLIADYMQILEPLLRYYPWLEQHAGEQMSSSYRAEEMREGGFSTPVYDSTLLAFVREASKSRLMDRNYPYVYTRNRIKDHDTERNLIHKATLKDWNLLCGILSKYVMGGKTKATLWSEAMVEQIFYLVLKKMKELVEQKPAVIELPADEQ